MKRNAWSGCNNMDFVLLLLGFLMTGKLLLKSQKNRDLQWLFGRHWISIDWREDRPNNCMNFTPHFFSYFILNGSSFMGGGNTFLFIQPITAQHFLFSRCMVRTKKEKHPHGPADRPSKPEEAREEKRKGARARAKHTQKQRQTQKEQQGERKQNTCN